MATERKPEMDAQAIMEIYKKLGIPGAAHKLLSKMVGKWDTLTKSWMEPGTPPEESAGYCEAKMILGGRFLQQDCTGQMMGTAFNGIGFTGFDNNTKEYVSTWMDSTGTGLYYFVGPANPDGKSFTQRCSYNDAVKGQMEWRSVCKLVDDNKILFEMYGTAVGGKEEKMMEMTYTRKV